MKQVEFFKLEGELKAVPTVGGWVLTCDNLSSCSKVSDRDIETLETARGSNRVFSELSTISKVCAENGMDLFIVEVAI